ncbi:hypothetical protein [Flavobacterium sp. BFFFF1]|uniref:hypothetical protein n=1 Tax=Flavobacterium sp. BFFFF1 TaxID=2015557 RepID=UPI0025C01D80|nr:hypothetical protein [Flavobacterium sp. BFFFF1]
MKKSDLLLYFLFVITASIVLLNRFTSFYINDYRVHFFFLFFAASSFVIIAGRLFKKLQSRRSVIVTCIVIAALCFVRGFLTWSGDWKTQTVLYESNTDKNKTINIQLRGDRFAFGYKERVIGVYRIAPFMDWVADVDTTNIDHSKWKRLDLQLNEMGLPKEK